MNPRSSQHCLASMLYTSQWAAPIVLQFLPVENCILGVEVTMVAWAMAALRTTATHAW